MRLHATLLSKMGESVRHCLAWCRRACCCCSALATGICPIPTSRSLPDMR
ncbi:hypothetical protein DLM_3259 [Aquitalea magnusonii]|uniref:Uncharacterized protein n=1 Tax=Aquitalea magnusonii TaxID=332411 RepID=A0A3G9GL00_9NEIS|nr:hypothetical protein DLM_3259 [Aquitalea magnusonii]